MSDQHAPPETPAAVEGEMFTTEYPTYTTGSSGLVISLFPSSFVYMEDRRSEN